MKSKIVGFMGAPSTGKTMLAGAMKEYAFLNGKVSTDVCTEYAREFVFKYGHPKHAYTQYRITSKQIERENILLNGNSQFIFTDSPVWRLTTMKSLLPRASQPHGQSCHPL